MWISEHCHVVATLALRPAQLPASKRPPAHRIASSRRRSQLAILSDVKAQSSPPYQSAQGKSSPSTPKGRDGPSSELLINKRKPNEDEEFTFKTRLLLLLPTEGQSDPFSALAIPITAEVNQIIAFGRDIFLPTLHHTTDTDNSIIVKRNFQVNANQLKDEGSALGLLACYATAASLASGDPTWTRKALKYETKCAALLRERLRSAPKSLYPEIITQILSLVGCAILTGRRIEAKPHIMILRTLFDLSEHGHEDIARLCFVLSHDRNLSVIQMIRSSFDADSWMPQVVAPIWNGLSNTFPHLNEVSPQKLDRSITQAGPTFTKFIGDTRDHYYTVVVTGARWLPTDIPSNLNMYHLSHSVLYETRLINHYLDMIEKPHVGPEDLWPQAYICLAALYMHHSVLYSPVINGVRRNNTSLLLKQHLQNAILRADRNATLLSQKVYRNALLWTLFVGATAERIGTGTSEDGSYWFNTRFEAHALSMGLTKWSDIQAIILGFPCAPELLSQDMTWVEESLRPPYERDGKVRLEAFSFRIYNNETGGFD